MRLCISVNTNLINIKELTGTVSLTRDGNLALWTGEIAISTMSGYVSNHKAIIPFAAYVPNYLTSQVLSSFNPNQNKIYITSNLDVNPGSVLVRAIELY